MGLEIEEDVHNLRSDLGFESMRHVITLNGNTTFLLYRDKATQGSLDVHMVVFCIEDCRSSYVQS